MSHVARVSLVVQDLSALKAACSRLGLEFVEGQKTFRVHASDGDTVCDHAIRIPIGHAAYKRGNYEIGVTKNQPGTFDEITLADGRKVKRDISNGYSLEWDSYMGGEGLRDIVGAGCSKLKQAYATVTTVRQMQKQGFRVVENRLANGNVQVVCSK